jgi:hypothetical protein
VAVGDPEEGVGLCPEAVAVPMMYAEIGQALRVLPVVHFVGRAASALRDIALRHGCDERCRKSSFPCRPRTATQ